MARRNHERKDEDGNSGYLDIQGGFAASVYADRCSRYLSRQNKHTESLVNVRFKKVFVFIGQSVLTPSVVSGPTLLNMML